MSLLRIDQALTHLTSVGVRPRIGHGENPLARVGEREVLIRELLPINALPPRPIPPREVPTLAHEAGNNTMERGTLVPEPRLAGAQLAEVLRRLRRDVRPKLHGDSPHVVPPDGHVKEHLGVTRKEGGAGERASGGDLHGEGGGTSESCEDHDDGKKS